MLPSIAAQAAGLADAAARERLTQKARLAEVLGAEYDDRRRIRRGKSLLPMVDPGQGCGGSSTAASSYGTSSIRSNDSGQRSDELHSLEVVRVSMNLP